MSGTEDRGERPNEDSLIEELQQELAELKVRVRNLEDRMGEDSEAWRR